MLVSWKHTEADSDGVSGLLKFLIENVENDHKTLLKYNIDLIKAVTELWGPIIKIPFDILLNKLNSETGLKIADIILANNLAPWGDTMSDMKTFLKKLLSLLETQNYRLVARVLGKSLNFMKNNFEACLEKFEPIVTKKLKKLEANKSMYCLECVSEFYGSIIQDWFLVKFIYLIEKHTSEFRSLILKLFLKRTDRLRAISDFRNFEFKRLLRDTRSNVQTLCLDIILNTIDSFTADMLKCLPVQLSPVQTDGNDKSKAIMYKILVKVYNKYKSSGEKIEIVATCRSMLLLGLKENGAEIEEVVIDFWRGNDNIPNEIYSRFEYLLSDMYSPNSEKEYLGYFTMFLLTLIKDKEEFHENICDFKPSGLRWEPHRLSGNWKKQHSRTPMFASSSSTQTYLSRTFSYASNVEATQSLQFEPTVAREQHETATTQTESDDHLFARPEPVSSNKRYYTDTTKNKRSMALRQVEKKVENEETRIDSTKQRERGVKIYRKYRKGDLPDFEIKLSDLITPLEALTKKDGHLAGLVCLSVFRGLVEKNKTDEFANSVFRGINKLLAETTQFNPNVIETFLSIALNHRARFDSKLSPSLVCDASRSSGLLAVGSLLLEEYIINDVDYAAPAKKSCSHFDDESVTSCWVKLAELYREMNEWDVVSSIFLKKMNCSDKAVPAIESEAKGLWEDAKQLYFDAFTDDQSESRNDFYYESYFKCLAHLSDWDNLSNDISSIIKSSPADDVWNLLWDQDWNQQKLLSWYFTAEIRKSLQDSSVKSQLMANINSTLINADRIEYFKSNFAEDLSFLSIIENDFGYAKKYLNISVSNFLDNWNHINPLFVSLRANKLLQTRVAMDIDMFIKCINDIKENNYDSVLNGLFSYWNKTSFDRNDKIILSEKKSVYRHEFVSCLRTKLSILTNLEDYENARTKLSSARFNLDFNLVQTSLEQNNFYLARKILNRHNDRLNKAGENVDDLKLLLLDGKTDILKCKLSVVDESQKLDILIAAWYKFQKYTTNLWKSSDFMLFLSAKRHIFDMTQEIINLSSDDPSKINANNRRMLEEIVRFERFDLSKIEHYGVKNLLESVKFCEQELPNLMGDHHEEVNEALAGAYVKLANYSKDKSSRRFICYTLRSMYFGSSEGRQLFPCLLNLNDLATYSNIFIEESAYIPTWMFLDWIPQLLANVDSEKVTSLKKIISNIAENYPQSIMYAYRLSKEKYSFENSEAGKIGLNLIEQLNELLLSNPIIESLLKSLSFVNKPNKSLVYHIKKLINLTDNPEGFRAYSQKIVEEFYSDSTRRNSVDSLSGSIWKKSDFKRDFENLNPISESIKEDLQKLKCKISNNKVITSPDLGDFSPWLANFHATKLEADIEIPGQYTGGKRPLTRHHVKISSFSHNVIMFYRFSFCC